MLQTTGMFNHFMLLIISGPKISITLTSSDQNSNGQRREPEVFIN